MPRQHNTDRNGNAWSDQTKKNVWSKATIIEGYPADTWRRDKCSKNIKYSEHGNRNSEYGWEIDHINPVANYGSDELNNLQPLYWGNNAAKGDKLNWQCGQK